MRNSDVTVSAVREAFLKTKDIKDADPEYYFNKVLDWSDSGNNMKINWIATIRGFARSDLRDNKLKMNRHSAAPKPHRGIS